MIISTADQIQADFPCSGQMNVGFISSNARMDQLELAVITSSTTITQNVTNPIAQSVMISENTSTTDFSNGSRKITTASVSRWKAKRPSARVVRIRLPFLFQKAGSWLFIGRAAVGISL